MLHAPTRRLCLALAAAATVVGGCADLRDTNVAPYVSTYKGNQFEVPRLAFRSSVTYPVRDIVALDFLWRGPRAGRAWNADMDFSGGTSWWQPRKDEELTPEALEAGPGQKPPQPPFRIVKKKEKGSPGFVGDDAQGRRYLFKTDDPDYPELGSSSALIAARALWALGYRVPPAYIVEISGTGDSDFDGRRASATEYLKVSGQLEFDVFRYRREARALRMASAWINDVDRGSRNNVIVEEDGRLLYYLIDLDSCLGSWQSRPKDTWRGHRHEMSLGWWFLEGISLRAVHPEPDPQQPIVSPAVGRFDATFDPMLWKPEAQNTAFEQMAPDDLVWIAGHIARLDRPRVAAIVRAARYSNPADEAYVLDTLMQRRAAILKLAGLPEESPERGAPPAASE